MDDEKTKRLRERLGDYLERGGIDTSKPFLCLNPGHKENNPSMTYYPKKNFVKCWSCNTTYSIFDLIGIDYGISSFVEQKAKAETLFSIGYIDPPKAARPPAGSAVKTKPISGENSMLRTDNFLAIKDQRMNYKKWHELVNQTKYWESRGITQETITRFNLGYDPGAACVIVPCTPTYYVARKVSETAKPKYVNPAGVPVQIFNEAALDQDQPVWIVEGAIDALSILQEGGQALATNSASILTNLVKAIKKRAKLPVLILSMDNDEAGAKASDTLRKEFDALKTSYIEPKCFNPEEDPNLALKSDIERFRRLLSETAEKIKIEAPETQSMITSTSFDAHLSSFMNRQIINKRIATGFPGLDRKLDGGLAPGLIVLGAMSSAGKTTYALQIANQAAQAGELVIFFSLEQSIDELITKSISYQSGSFSQAEVMAIAADDRDLDETKAQVYLDTCDKVYSYGNNLYVIEEARTPRQIGEAIFTLAAQTGKTPLVIIDYLQIIQPDEGGQERRAGIDQIVTDLKLISKKRNCPIMVISSFNRDNYYKDVTEAAFKESGGIEYSSDLLLGLQFECLDPVNTKKEVDIDKEKAQNPRKMQIKVIKNRSGQAGGRLNYNYNARNNKFSEV